MDYPYENPNWPTMRDFIGIVKRGEQMPVVPEEEAVIKEKDVAREANVLSNLGGLYGSCVLSYFLMGVAMASVPYWSALAYFDQRNRESD